MPKFEGTPETGNEHLENKETKLSTRGIGSGGFAATILEGTLEGKPLRIREAGSFGEEERTYSGTIDGRELTPEEAEKIFKEHNSDSTGHYLEGEKELNETPEEFEAKWREKFTSQEDWVLEKTVESMEHLLKPDTPTVTLDPKVREQGEVKLRLAKEELESRN